MMSRPIAGPNAPEPQQQRATTIKRPLSSRTSIEFIHYHKQQPQRERLSTTINSQSHLQSPITTIKMTQSKEQKIEEVRTKLPLPEQPPVASDWQSADARTVNVGAGGVSSDISTGAGSTSGLREPASKGADVDLSGVGRQGKDNLEGLPKDAKA